MSEFLKSVKSDLSDRRLLPVVALVAVGLLAAIGYVVVGGKSSASNATVTASTTAGDTQRRHRRERLDLGKGRCRDHQRRLRTARGQVSRPLHADRRDEHHGHNDAATTAASSTSAGSGSSETSSGSTETSTKTTETTSKPATKSKPKTVYHVAIEFGVFPAGATPETVVLTPYENLKLQTPAAELQAAADRLPRRHQRRQERDLLRSSAKRSCTASGTVFPAPASARRWT